MIWRRGAGGSSRGSIDSGGRVAKSREIADTWEKKAGRRARKEKAGSFAHQSTTKRDTSDSHCQTAYVDETAICLSLRTLDDADQTEFANR